MKKWLFLLIWGALFFCPKRVLAQSISNINIGPSLDVSYFGSYTLNADIADYPSSSQVNIGVSGINGDGGPYWSYYVDGSNDPKNLNYEMSYVTGITWRKTNIRPDHIYPEIFFAPSSITWANAPSNLPIRRNDYHLLHFNNPFGVTGGMSFWIEINAVPRAANSADLQVYLVKKTNSVSFFQTNWIPGVGDSNAELVGTISRSAIVNHTHSDNSAHHLVALTANEDGTIGANHLDISGDFWIVLYNTSPNISRGWDLRYQTTSLCNNDSRWYRGNFTGWTTVAQSGCPDVHTHFVRRSGGKLDGVRVVVSAGTTSASQSFYFGPLPNLAPIASSLISPNGGAVAGTIEVAWNPASDPNGDVLTYFAYLLDIGGSVARNLSSGTTGTILSWDTNTVANGSYGIGVTVCDPASLCAQFNSDTNFLVNNTSPIYSLTSISIGPTRVMSGETLNLDFVSSDSLPVVPTVNFYASGVATQNVATVSNTGGNNWRASLVVGESDANGELSFVIRSASLENEYYQSTDGSQVLIDNPLPTATPTPTSTPTPTLTMVVQNNNSFSSFSSAPICGDAKPVSAPDLFQIDSFGKSAKLFFTPVANTKQYYISFSTKPGAEEHGELVSLLSEGVQSHKVFFLKPNATYYFKVRAQNGCMPGAWSNVMKIRTDFRKYYKYVVEKKKAIEKKTETKLAPSNALNVEVKKPIEEIKVETKVQTEKENFWQKIRKLFRF